MNGRVDLRVACPVGIIGTAALRTVAELSGAWGIDRLTIGHRQDLLVAGIPDSYVARFRAAVAPLDVDRADTSGHPNITSSAAATGIMRGARWLDAGIMQSILAGIRLRPSFAVNVADPHQDLLPLTSGLVNFLAADEVESWRIAIAADHHPRRGARAPGRHTTASRFPTWCRRSTWPRRYGRPRRRWSTPARNHRTGRRIWRTRSAPVWVPGW